MRLQIAAVALLASGLAGCGQEPEPAAPGETDTAMPEAPASEPVVAPEAPPVMAATASAEGAQVFFVEPADGATVSSPVKLVFGVEGMAVVPAGDQAPHSGHHHLLIDEPEVDLSMPLPTTEQIVHFGKGQTETEIELAPGEHRLQLLLGDWKHRPHDPPVSSETITITVTEEETAPAE